MYKDKIKINLNLGRIILIIIVLMVSISIYLSWKSPFAKAVRKGERINGIIIGTDWVDYSRHSDTLIFISYSPFNRFLDIVSVPRDTKFSPPGYNFRRINEVYAYHFKKTKNDHLACKEVKFAIEKLLFDKVLIPYYFQINYASFKKFIDMMGGVIIDIPEPMHYDDNAGDLHIDFKSGRQILDGQKSLEYVRFRGATGDMGRIYRQQMFLKAVLSRWKNPLLLFNLPKILAVTINETKTNFSIYDMMIVLLELKDLHIKNVRLAQLPGKPRHNYWIMDEESSIGLFEKILPSDKTVFAKGPRIRVSVWNASGKIKLAEKITWLLRKNSYDVIEYGNFNSRAKNTVIRDLSGDLRPAQNISDIIGCGETVTRYDAKRFTDISIILGEDCKYPE